MKLKIAFYTFISIIFLLLIVVCLTLGRTFPSVIRIDKKVESRKELKMNPNLFYRQTFNNCGPYSVMAVLNVLKHQDPNPELLVKAMRWRMKNNRTFPQGIIDLLSENGIQSHEYVLSAYNEQNKILWLKSILTQNRPIIVLLQVNNVLHYVTLLGYDDKGFMLYDSMQEKQKKNSVKTIDDNPLACGNRYYSYQEFLEKWNHGGWFLFFRNWALVCHL